LARDVVLPPAGTVTTLVRAKQTSPPYVSDQLITDLHERLGSEFTLLDFDCNHMVPYSRPAEVAALTRELLEAR
jgi:lipase